MILILSSNVSEQAQEYQQLLAHLATLPGIQTRVHVERGIEKTLTEIYLIGNTKTLEIEDMQNLPCVERAVRVSEEYRILGRHKDDQRPTHFEYNGVRFGQDTLNVFAGLCAVDNREHVEIMLKAVHDNGQVCTRMGAYKPRTSPYAFQGHGKYCLPYVFELAGKYGIKVIAMEITHESHLNEIREALHQTGNPTACAADRHAQHAEFRAAEDRRAANRDADLRGFGITLDESLNAAEYLASEGNRNVVFGLRGMKTNMGDPHRNFVDFSHVPVVKRLTRMPVCIDPSHSVGSRQAAPDGILDMMHVTAQGIVAGANMVLVDFHPAPPKALVDGPQAMLLRELPYFLEDVQIAREAYLKRVALRQQQV
jgi:3-deoxy-D-arabino-heptulosonate 7-phosphate (DAHP) synthase